MCVCECGLGLDWVFVRLAFWMNKWPGGGKATQLRRGWLGPYCTHRLSTVWRLAGLVMLVGAFLSLIKAMLKLINLPIVSYSIFFPSPKT